MGSCNSIPASLSRVFIRLLFNLRFLLFRVISPVASLLSLGLVSFLEVNSVWSVYALPTCTSQHSFQKTAHHGGLHFATPDFDEAPPRLPLEHSPGTSHVEHEQCFSTAATHSNDRHHKKPAKNAIRLSRQRRCSIFQWQQITRGAYCSSRPNSQ